MVYEHLTVREIERICRDTVPIDTTIPQDGEFSLSPLLTFALEVERRAFAAGEKHGRSMGSATSQGGYDLAGGYRL